MTETTTYCKAKICQCLQHAPVLHGHSFFGRCIGHCCRKSNKLCPPSHRRARTRVHRPKRSFAKRNELDFGGQAAPITLNTRPDPDGCLRCHLLFHLFLFFSVTDLIEHVTDSDAHMAAAAA